MFVSATMAGGIGRSGLISVSNTGVATPFCTRTTATSVTRSPRHARVPVVSTSTTTNDSVAGRARRRSYGVGEARRLDGHGFVAQLPAAIDGAREAALSGEQRRRHVFGDVAGAPGSWQTYEMSAYASAGPPARNSSARVSEQRVGVAECDAPAIVRPRRSAPRIVALDWDRSCSAARRRRAPAPRPRT